jgi:hypothetical protein
MKSCGLVVNVLLLAGLCGCAAHLATVKQYRHAYRQDYMWKSGSTRPQHI